jgi:type IV pilus assembly protein PilA
MKTEFKAKFLQHVAKRKKEEGFTLIELLVVIIIIGILSAIALPSFLNQANKAKQSEAKQYVSSLNKGQQAYFTEKGTFYTGTNIADLGVGIKTQTTNYQYFCTGEATSALCVGKAVNTGSLNSYSGSIFLEGDPKTSRSILCETTSPAQTTFITQGATDCGSMKAVGG